jgi:hypothetical protein
MQLSISSRKQVSPKIPMDNRGTATAPRVPAAISRGMKSSGLAEMNCAGDGRPTEKITKAEANPTANIFFKI